MTKQSLTAIFIILAIAIIAGYDLYADIVWSELTTISAVTRAFAAPWPFWMVLIAFGMGCLYGHLFLGHKIN